MNILAYRQNNGHPALSHNMTSLINAFSQLGHTVYICEVPNSTSIQATSQLLLNNIMDFTISFNQLLLDMSFYNGKKNIRIYDYIDSPHVSIMLDQAFNPHSGGINFSCRKHIITYLDRSDEFIMNNCFSLSTDKHIFFMPLGGTINENYPDIYRPTRKYDILFSSFYWSPECQWRANTNDFSKHICRLLDEVTELMLYVPCNIKDGFIQVLNAHGFYDIEYLQKMSKYFWPVLKYVKTKRKIELVKHLINLGLKIDVVGAGWENTPFVHKLNCHGEKTFAEMLNYVSESKVIVTDMAGFNSGAHDRVFTGMLNGAVVVSEYSSYLDEIFDNKKDLFMFDWKNAEQQLEVIDKLLSDETYRLSIAQNAYRKAIENHTWENRAERILEAVALCYNLSD